MRKLFIAIFIVLGTHALADDELENCIIDASMEVEVAKNDGDVLKASKSFIKNGYLDWLTIFEQFVADIVKDHNNFVNPQYDTNAAHFPKETSITNPKDALDVLKRRYAHLVGLIIFEERDPLEFSFFGVVDRWKLTKTLWNSDLDVKLYQCFLTRIGSNYDPFNKADTKITEQELANNFKQTKYGKLLLEQTDECLPSSINEYENVAIKIGASFSEDGRLDPNSVELIDLVGANMDSINALFIILRRSMLRCEKDGFDFPEHDYLSWRYITVVLNPAARK